MSHVFDDDPLEDAAHPGPWPAFVDLFAATALIMLVLFAVLAARYVHVMRDRKVVETNVDSLYRAMHGLSSARNGLSVTRRGTDVLIVLEESVSFPPGKARLSDMKEVGRLQLHEIGRRVQTPKFSALFREVDVIGHADSTRYRSAEHSNWELSAQRAAAVAQFLVDSLQFDSCRVIASGRSDYYPRSRSGVAAAAGTDPLAADRRVEILLHAMIGDSSQMRPGCRGVVPQ